MLCSKKNRFLPDKQFSIPRKSIFGFRILNAYQSIIFSYLFIILHFISFSFGSTTKIELISKSIYSLISNLSYVILSLNIFLKRNELKLRAQKIVILPILFFLPYAILCLIINSIFVYSLLSLNLLP